MNERQRLAMGEGKAYFKGLFGNDSVKQRIGKAIENGTLPHAFLFVGQSGSGKKTLASLLAMALNCEEKHDSRASLPCGVCNTCRRIREDNFTDIMRLRRSDGKATIGVDEVRLFREDMFLSPTEAAYKLYVIEEAERLTPNAQNALLTVLEEPPTNVVILLLCEESDKILGLSVGADDYITKPFSPPELIARVKSQLRRYMSLGDYSSRLVGGDVSIGGLTLRTSERTVLVEGEPVKLTAKEYSILELLMANAGRVYSAEQIYEKVWHETAYAVENTVMVHIRRIREKIEINPREPKYLKVVWGVGYKIEKI
jgi:DNA-binding response OmpR family regulator